METAMQDNQKEMLNILMSYSALGLEMGFCVVIGLGMGYYLDKYFGTDPYLTFSFMILGIIAAFRAVYAAYKRLKKEDERNNSR